MAFVTINLEKEDISQIVYEVVNAKAAGPDSKDKRAPEKRKRKSKIQVGIREKNGEKVLFKYRQGWFF